MNSGKLNLFAEILVILLKGFSPLVLMFFMLIIIEIVTDEYHDWKQYKRVMGESAKPYLLWHRERGTPQPPQKEDADAQPGPGEAEDTPDKSREGQ